MDTDMDAANQVLEVTNADSVAAAVTANRADH
jgi:hypothetical protein